MSFLILALFLHLVRAWPEQSVDAVDVALRDSTVAAVGGRNGAILREESNSMANTLSDNTARAELSGPVGEASGSNNSVAEGPGSNSTQEDSLNSTRNETVSGAPSLNLSLGGDTVGFFMNLMARSLPQKLSQQASNMTLSLRVLSSPYLAGLARPWSLDLDHSSDRSLPTAKNSTVQESTPAARLTMSLVNPILGHHHPILFPLLYSVFGQNPVQPQLRAL